MTFNVHASLNRLVWSSESNSTRRLKEEFRAGRLHEFIRILTSWEYQEEPGWEEDLKALTFNSLKYMETLPFFKALLQGLSSCSDDIIDVVITMQSEEIALEALEIIIKQITLSQSQIKAIFFKIVSIGPKVKSLKVVSLFDLLYEKILCNTNNNGILNELCKEIDFNIIQNVQLLYRVIAKLPFTCEQKYQLNRKLFDSLRVYKKEALYSKEDIWPIIRLEALMCYQEWQFEPASNAKLLEAICDVLRRAEEPQSDGDVIGTDMQFKACNFLTFEINTAKRAGLEFYEDDVETFAREIKKAGLDDGEALYSGFKTTPRPEAECIIS